MVARPARTQVFEYSVEVSKSVTGPEEFRLQIRRIMGWGKLDDAIFRSRSFSRVHIRVNFFQYAFKIFIIICIFAEEMRCTG